MKSTAILFPLMVNESCKYPEVIRACLNKNVSFQLVVMMLVRKTLDYFFTQPELLALDDALPGSNSRKNGDHDAQSVKCGSTEFNGW